MDAEIIISLAQARIRKDTAYAKMKQVEERFKAMTQYQLAANELTQATDALDDADEIFRQEALSEFYADQNKNKHKDCYDIAITKSVTIPDEAQAVRWCITNFTPALSLKRKPFEEAVKAGSIPADVAFALDVPTVRVHSDLSEWLKGE